MLGELFSNSMIQGHVQEIEGPYNERPDFDWINFLAKIGLVCVLGPLLLIPFGIVIGVVLLLGILGMGFLGGLLAHTGCALSGCLLPWLSHRRSRDVPVRFVTVLDDAQQEHAIRLKGELLYGNINPGNLVTFYGRWKGGTLHSYRGFNHNTRSQIKVRKPFPVALVFFVILTLLLLIVLISGPPHR